MSLTTITRSFFLIRSRRLRRLRVHRQVSACMSWCSYHILTFGAAAGESPVTVSCVRVSRSAKWLTRMLWKAGAKRKLLRA